MTGRWKDMLPRGDFFIPGVAALVAAVLPSPALACRTSHQMRTFLFASLPPFLPQGAVSARVKVVTMGSWQHPEIRARLIEMVSGPKHVRMVRIVPTQVSTCDMMPATGATGIVVGRLVSYAKGELVLEPMRAPFKDR